MKNIKLNLFIGIFALALATPGLTQAYFTTGQSATLLNENTILFTVTYEFGFPERELYMPIVAQLASTTAEKYPYVKYVIQDKKRDAIDTGVTKALVLTNDEDVKIKDGQYYVPAGKAAKFTLVSLLTIEPTETLDLSLLVTRLPFTMVKAGTPIPASLNPSELQYYRTPEVKIK